MLCPICDHNEIKTHRINYPCFRHQDFQKIAEGTWINQCQNCSAIFKNEAQIGTPRIKDIYLAQEYAEQKKTDHMVMIDDHRSVTTYFLQTQLIEKMIDKTNLHHILDIGCFDGKLLLELDNLFESAIMHGFDMSNHIKNLFPKRKNFLFWSGDLAQVNGKYDLICLSHSIQYICDVKSFMKEISRLLKNDGKIFIQVPDLSKNYYSLLYGDLYYHYTPEIMKNIFGQFGFEATLLEEGRKWFPRDLLITVQRKKSESFNDYFKVNIVDQAEEYLHQVVNKLISYKNKGDLCVLGTTLNASFIHSTIEKEIKWFVDENPKKIGNRINGKEVVSPERLSDKETILVPYGETGSMLCEKLKAKYNGTFINL